MKTEYKMIIATVQYSFKKDYEAVKINETF